jgi:hypothetical protein
VSYLSGLALITTVWHIHPFTGDTKGIQLQIAWRETEMKRFQPSICVGGSLFVPVSTGHPVSSPTAKNDVSSGCPTVRHSAVAANTMHSGIHCSCKQELDGKETADPALFW